MRMASVGPIGMERPAWVSDDAALCLSCQGESWREILEDGLLGEERALALESPPEAWSPLAGQRLGPVIPNPSKIIAVGLNYRDHALEQGKKPPDSPLLFSKAPSCLIGSGDPIRVPPQEGRVDAEAELAIVIGARAWRVRADETDAVILGYTIMNDVSGREAQFGDKQFFRGKSFDSFGPCGPWIVAAEGFDPCDRGIRCFWNGRKMQESSTSQLIFPPRDLVSYISHQMTLLPGDIIATGTPAGVGVFRDPPVFMKPGDVVRVEIDGIGVLENPVSAG